MGDRYGRSIREIGLEWDIDRAIDMEYGFRYGIRYIDMVILHIDMGYGLMI
jgi:hypothetical protein